jgi:hypothetical protein
MVVSSTRLKELSHQEGRGYSMDTVLDDLASTQKCSPFPPALKALLIETAGTLKGSDRRMFMAETVRMLGRGGQRKAAQELGWDRKTIRKGEYELQHGAIHDQFSHRGRKKAAVHFPS